MAEMTLEEAFAAATVDVPAGMVDDVLIIDAPNRKIIVPDSESTFGVETDKDVERKYFRCPRIVGDNIDLYAHKIYVVYVAAKDVKGAFLPEIVNDRYWCDDVTVDGDCITFSWKLSDNVMSRAGIIAFKVLAVTTDGEFEKTRWNTAPAYGTILLTVPDGDDIAERYPDIVTQLLERMDAVEKIATEEAMKGYVSEYMENHPVQLDETLTDNTKAAPAGIVGELKGDIEQLKQNGGSGSAGSGSGVTTAQASSLWAIVQKAAFVEVLTDEELNTFKAAWGIATETIPATGIALDKSTLSFIDSASQTLVATVTPSDSTDVITWESSNTEIATVSGGDVTPISNGSCTITAKAGSYSASCAVTVAVEGEIVTLQSISATYTGGDVAVGTALTDLTGITVTATYSDGSTSEIKGYALSGEILEGSNIITVSYGSKTTTFTVTGVAESGGGDEPVVLRGYQFTEFNNIYGDSANYEQWKWNVGIANRFTFTTKLFPAGTYWIRYLMKSGNSSEIYAPLMYQTADADWLTTKSDAPTAITIDQFWACKKLGDDDDSTFMIVNNDGSYYFSANELNDGTENFVYLIKVTVPEGYYGILTLCIGSSNNTKVAYVENWVTAFYEDPTNYITCTEVTG